MITVFWFCITVLFAAMEYQEGKAQVSAQLWTVGHGLQFELGYSHRKN